MIRRTAVFASLALATLSLASSPLRAQYEGWTIPATAKGEKSPFAGSADAVRKGKSTFQSKCQRCHGPEGIGNGPDADRNKPPADLTAVKAAENPDGVVFYKIWNGRTSTNKRDMQAFKVQLPRDEVWQVVEYVKTLRKAAK